MRAVELLRLPLVFGRAHRFITLSEGGAVATRNGLSWRTAASQAVMRSGRHFVQFTVVLGYMFFGVIRPGGDLDEGTDDHHALVVRDPFLLTPSSEAETAVRRENADLEEDGHCFYNTGSGRRWPGRTDWEGRQGAKQQGDRIGILLDLDQGCMTLWKNGEKLGVMQAEGLRGPLCWAVSMGGRCSARIESAPAPASPTGEELAAAKAWQRAECEPAEAPELQQTLNECNDM